jgi:hypothetical protein
VSTLAHRYNNKSILLPWSELPLSSPDRDLSKEQRDYLKQFDHLKHAIVSVNGYGRGDGTQDDAFQIDEESFQWRSADFQKISEYFSVIREIKRHGMHNKIAGELVGHVLDDDGNSLGHEFEVEIEKIAARVPLDRLSQIARRGSAIGIGARRYKARALRMAVRKGIVNSLVIDREIAYELIEAAGQQAGPRLL